MARDPVKGKEADLTSDGPAGTFEDPHKLTFSIRDLSANSVVLYPDQAEITRDIENVQLKPGVNEVTIKDLTGYCQEHSIKVEGKGDAIITDMVVEPIYQHLPFGVDPFSKKSHLYIKQGNINSAYSDSESEEEEEEEEESESDLDFEDDPDFSEVTAIDKQIKELKLQGQDAAEELKSSEIQLAALERYGATITAEMAAPETMTQFLDAYQESRKILYKQNKAAKVTMDRVEREIARKYKERVKKSKKPMAAKAKQSKQKQKDKAKKNEAKVEREERKKAARRLRPGNSYRVKVMVETNSETEASLTLKYLVNNASWFPRYDLRLDSIAKTGQIVYRAHFENKTYETWRDAKITFSSSAQTFGGLREVVPVMTAWTLSLRKGFASYSGDGIDNTAGLYSIKEQDALAKRGITFGPKKNAHSNNSVNRFQMQQLAQQQNIVQTQQMAVAQAKGGSLFGNAAPQQALGGFGQANNANNAMAPQPAAGGLFGGTANTAFGAVAHGSTLGDMPPPPGGGFGAAAGGAPAPHPFAGGYEVGGGGGPINEKDESDIGDGDASTLAPARAAMLIAESSSSESYGMTTTYEIAGLKTIKSSPIVRRQAISTIDLTNVSFSSIAVVKLRAAAFLKARFKNTSKHTLLRGMAGLTVDGSFLGQTNLPHCPPDDTISLSLGVDTGVHVSYAKPTLVSSSQGFISKENVTLYKRSIFIHNAKSQMLTLTVLDQVPVSEDERLRVNVVNPKGLREGGEAVKTGAPGSAALDNRWGTASAVMKTAGNGEIAYTVKLEKGRSCKLPLEYEVKLPAGEKIVGLS
ncbi:hypothetical protein H072_4410 [Dactylellina haptotyla CBS 200.50]|uniref:DUF4139 domain-containing protein n=1 Tax=Dactylellina haptotyla (strain CBS 200.50) TaxID=1284197 RepID=S8AF43_DACHA|nr:hypothetical protein H072_4410 [Dactylellina haptotyla CBS 200.50]